MTDDPRPDPIRPPAGASSDAPNRRVSLTEGAGATLGPYHLIQKIGEGGMGEVWLAEQRAPIGRTVAVKIIKAGMDTKQVVARFEAERQALVLMEHPAIARIFDAGKTPRGLPYFAMEYVKGEPINTFCDLHRFNNQERLELFTQVCEGVQHAHQKGVIHRDLKPSNVLVTAQEDRMVPKIIDFGVAKAIDQCLTEKTMFTELGVLVGTPEYMSPEQAEMGGQDIDTRTDVYALGIILYQLLVGALPIDPEELRKAGFDEIRRRIRESDLPRPSARISTMGEASTESARNRRTEPAKLVSQLKGDLDWITMKALEKDRTRRYATPSELAADLMRYLRHEPVLAGPPTVLYRTRKFVRRHQSGVAMVAIGVLALVGFVVTMGLQAKRIAKERSSAERVSEFLVNLFKVSDPSEARGNQITAREILDTGVETIQKELTDEPEIQARLILTMGNVYSNLGLWKEAEPMLRRAVDIRQRILGEDNLQTMISLHALAYLDLHLARYNEAETLYRRVVDVRTRVLGREHPDTLGAMNGLAVVYETQGRFAESEKLYRRVLEVRRRVLGEDHPDTLWSLNNVANTLANKGQNEEAEPLHRQVLEGRRRVLGRDHPDTLDAMEVLAGIFMNEGDYIEAEKLFLETLEARRRVLGDGHPDTLDSQGELANLYWMMTRYDEAERLYLQVLDANRRYLGADHPNTLVVMDNLGNVYSDMGRHSEAEKLVRECYEGYRRTLGPENPDTLIAASNLAHDISALGDYAGAEKLFLETLALDRRVFGEEAPSTLANTGALASVYAKQGRHDEAERLFLDTLEKMRRVLGESNRATLIATYKMGCAQALRGDRLRALDWIRRAVEHGYREADRIAKNPDCQSLHGDPLFEELLATARKNAAR